MLKSGFTYVITGFLNALTPFILLPYLTNELSVRQYGELGLFMTVVSLLPPLLGLNLNGAAFRKFFEKNKINVRYNISCFIIFLINSIILFGITLIFLDQISALLKLSSEFILLAFLASVNAFLITFFLSQLQAMGEYKSYSAILLIHSALNLLLTYYFISQLNWGLEGRILAIIGAGLVMTVVLLVAMSMRKVISLRLPSKMYIIDALKYSLPLLPHSFLSLLMIQSDKLLIQYSLGADMLGLYMAAFQISLIAKVFYTSLNTAYSPWLMKKLSVGGEGLNKFLVSMIYKFTFIQLVLAIIAYPVTVWIAEIMVNDKFGDIGVLAYSLVIVQMLHGFYFLFANFIFYSKKTSVLLKPSLISVILGIGFIFSFINLIGVWAAVLGLAVSKIVLVMLVIHQVNQEFKLSWKLTWCR